MRHRVLLAALLLLLAVPGSAHAAGALSWRQPLGRGAQSHPGVATPAVNPQARADLIRALTGYDPSQLETRHECAAPSLGRASCMAETLVSRGTGKRIRPRLAQHATRPTVQPSLAPGFVAPATSAPSGQAPPSVGDPAYLQQAYDLMYLSQTGGVGDTVAIVDAYDDPHAEADLAVYRAKYGLAPCTTANGCFRKVNQSGQASPLPSPDSGWAVEETLDLDAVSALCPNCHILLIEANTSYSTDLQAAVITANSLGARQISNSYGGPGTGPWGTYTFPGVATLASSGDWGSYADSAYQLYPASNPGVTSVGGTMITPSGGGQGGRGIAESAWTNYGAYSTGTGCVTVQAKPAWQHDVGCPGRSDTDVSATADPDTGLRIYDSDYGWFMEGGTSLSSPLTAAYLAITGIDGSSPIWAYNVSSTLFDPSGGTVLGNTTFAPNGCPAYIAYICTAQTGYDGPSGIGSISGATVNGAPGVGAPSVGTGAAANYVKATTATTATLVGGIYPNGVDTTYHWDYGTTTGYGQQTQPVDVGAGGAPVATSDTLSGLSPSSTYHYRLVATNLLGTTYGYDYTLSTTVLPPVNLTPPAVSGAALQGQMLSSTGGTWTPSSASLSYQWQRSADGTTWTNISGAVASSYTLTAADVGGSVRSMVTASTSAGPTSVPSSNTIGPVASAAPHNTVAPSISGTTAQGQVLTVASTWNPAGSTYTYAWQRSTDGSTWSTIPGASASSYTLTSADEGASVRATVTAVNSFGSAQATSSPVGPVIADPPQNTVAPYMSGTSQRTYALSVTQGTWKGGGNVYSYRWQRSADGAQTWTTINGQTTSSYTLAQADEGDYVRALITASNPDGAVSAASNATAAVVSPYPPANTAPPTITGTAERTFTLTATLGTWTGPNLSYAFQWQHDAGFGWQNISGATASTYTLQASDENTYVRVVVSASNVDATILEASAPSLLVLDALPVNQTPPSITGAAQRASTLTSNVGVWTGLQNTYSYQWQRSTNSGASWSDIQGATSASYTVSVADENAIVHLIVTATNPDGSASATSNATATIPAAPPIATAQPTLSGSAKRGQTLTATQGTWSGIGNTYSYQWQRSLDSGQSWSDVVGSTALNYVVPRTDEGAELRLKVTATNPDAAVSAATPASATVLADPPAITAAPTVSGTLLRGSTLTATAGSFSGLANTYSWQWQRSADGQTWTNIQNATATTYTLTTADETTQVRAVQTAVNPDGTAIAPSAPTPAVPSSKPINTVRPSITGTAQRGGSLTASQGTWSGIGNGYAYQWQSSTDGGTTWAAIRNATSADYSLGVADEGELLRIQVTATNPDGTLAVQSQPAGPVQASPPVNTGAPALSGTSQRGATLTASLGTWSGIANAYTYQWQRSPDGQAWTNIAGATSPSYILGVADENAAVRVEITATNPDATVRADSAATATIPPAPPVNTALPTVSGTAQRAAVLTATQGTWSGIGNTYAYQWQRNAGSGFTNITGATGPTYTLGVADENATIRVEITATNADATVTADSAQTATVPAAPPVNSAVPVVSGTAQRSITLTATHGTWGGIGNAYTYQWQRSSDGLSWTDILGATALSYTLAVGDEGYQLHLAVTAVNPDGVLTVTSTPTATVAGAPPVNTAIPTITGSPQRAVTLSGTPGTWGGLGNTYAYQWQSSTDAGTTWAAVNGATSPSYTPVVADEGAQLRLQVTASNPDASVTAASAPSAAVAAAPPTNTTAPSVSGTAQRAQTLTGAAGTWSGLGNSYAYRWQSSTDGATWSDIPGATGATYTPSAADEGARLRYLVTATNADLPAGLAVASVPTAAVAADPPITTALPIVSGTAQRSFTLTATQGSWAGAGNTYAYTWQRYTGGQGWQAIAGATAATYTLIKADEGSSVRALVTATNPDASVSAASVPTATVLDAPPQNVTAPAVGGIARLNGTLTATPGAWTPDDVTVSYRWQRSAPGGGFTDIAGATGQTYTPSGADVGQRLRVIATGANPDGAQGAASQPTATVAQPPVNLSAPNAPTGTLLNGYTLSADAGAWDTPGATFGYQWMRCPAAATSLDGTCTTIGGATRQTYTLQIGDIGSRIAVEVTASSVGGDSAAASSPLTGTVAGVSFTNTVPPSISGSPQVPQTLAAHPGTWSTTPSVLIYTWMRCDADGTSNCAQVSTASTYTLGANDNGHTIVLYATATALGQTATAHSPALTIQAQPLPQNTVAPAISGTPTRLQTLTSSQGAWTGSPTSLATQWERCDSAGASCQPISGATDQGYVLTQADEGYTIEAKVTAANTSGSASASSAPTGVVAGALPVSTHAPAITGLTYQQDVTLAVASGSGTWSGPADTTFATAWQRCDASAQSCVAIAGASSSQYTPTAADTGHTLIVTVSATNVDGTASANSPATPVILPAAPRWKALPILSQDPGHIGDLLTITPGTWSGPALDADSVQMMSCTSACRPAGTAGDTSYTISSADLGAILRVRETATNAGGSTVVWSSRYVGPVVSAAAGSVVLRDQTTVVVKNTRGQVLATAQLQTSARAAGDAPMRAFIAARRNAVRTVVVRRARGITGQLSAWVCPVAVPGSNASLRCTAKVSLRTAATLRLPASMAGKVRVVVVRKRG